MANATLEGVARTGLTREEKKAQTRARLLDAAAVVFARRGFVAASLDEVAEEAGLTKGAIYSNFENKDDLFNAVVDERLYRRFDAIPEAVEAGTLAERADEGGRMYMAAVEEERTLLLLDFERAIHQARNPDQRGRFVARDQEMRAALAQDIADEAEAAGIELPMPPEELLVAFFSIGSGIALRRLTEPESVPDDLFGRIIALIYAGMPRRRDPST